MFPHTRRRSELNMLKNIRSFKHQHSNLVIDKTTIHLYININNSAFTTYRWLLWDEFTRLNTSDSTHDNGKRLKLAYIHNVSKVMLQKEAHKYKNMS